MSIHWHGVDVPNREDGVSGVTQDALRPGESYTYRFRAEQVGTFWYHTHQNAAGGSGSASTARSSSAHGSHRPASTWSRPSTRSPARSAIGSNDGVEQREVAPGTPVRLRLVNTDSAVQRARLEGTAFRVVCGRRHGNHRPACGGGRGDRGRRGWALRPRLLRCRTSMGRARTGRDRRRRSRLGPGTRDRGVETVGASRGSIRPATGWPRCRSTSPSEFLSAAPTSTSIGSLGFVYGCPGAPLVGERELFPETPMYVVCVGRFVRMTVFEELKGRSSDAPPRPPLLVLSWTAPRSGRSTWWVETPNVQEARSYEVGRATNPGYWTSHCQNPPHVADGLTMHVSMTADLALPRRRRGPQPPGRMPSYAGGGGAGAAGSPPVATRPFSTRWRRATRPPHDHAARSPDGARRRWQGT